MVGDFGVDGTNPSDVVGDFAEVGPEFGDVHAALAVLLELEGRAHEGAGAAFGFDLDAGQRLAVVLIEHGLRVEAVDGGQAAVHEQEDDAFDALGVIEGSGAERAAGAVDEAFGSGNRLVHQASEGHHAETVADAAQSFAAGGRVRGLMERHVVLPS